MNIYELTKSDLIQNKYTKWYFSIIEKAATENRNRSDGGYERHHILPSSIYPNYKKSKWNIVLLTHREHFIVHWLLTKCFHNKFYTKKMLSALGAFMNNSNNTRITSSHHFEIAREARRQHMIGQQVYIANDVTRLKMSDSAKKREDLYGESNPSKRPEIREKISQNRIGKCAGEDHPNWGKTTSDKQKQRASEANKGKIVSDETRKKLSEASKLMIGDKNGFYGKKHSNELKEHWSKLQKEKWLKIKKKWMYSPEGQEKHVISDEFDSYLESNWKFGRPSVGERNRRK